MALVVTGLSQTGDTEALHKALADAGLPTDPLQVIGPDDSAESVSRGIIGAELFGAGPETGTGVPGINYARTPSQFFRTEALPDRLGDLEIPDSEVENYVEALERGRTVVAYFANPANVDKVEEAFKSANIANVRRY